MSDISSTPSGLTGAGGGNKIRITGMATGLDVDGMVKKMMVAEQVKVDKAKQAQQVIQWKKDAYNDIIKDIKDLQSSFFDSSSSDKNILSSANFAGFDTSVVSGSSASISAVGTGVQVGSYKVKVDGLATKPSIIGSIVNGTDKTLSTTLSELGLTDTDSFNITYTGATQAKPISVSTTDKISDVISKINSATSGAVTASFSQLTGKFTLQSANTGASQSIKINGETSSGKALWALGLASENNSEKKGTYATVTITPPGATTGTTVTRPTNNFTIDGMNYNLTGTGETNVNVTQNSDKVYDKVKTFLDKYNAIVDKIQTKLTEKKDYSYKPLTDAQKSSMKDADITSWENKAKQGILKNDDNLKNLLNNLRSAFSTAVTGTGISMGKYGDGSIGLDFSRDNQKPAHIDIVDASKLKASISSKGEQILKFFTNVSTDKSIELESKAYNESGIFNRMKKILEDNVGFTNTSLNTAILTKYANKQDDFSSTGTSGSATLSNQIYQKQILINQLNKSLSTKQESYYQKFAKLESAMNSLNSQQGYLSKQLG